MAEEFVPQLREYEIEEEEGEEEYLEGLEEDVLPETLEDELDEIQSEHEYEESVEEIPRKRQPTKKMKKTFELDDAAKAELYRDHDPSYTNVRFPYYLICEKRIAERMKQVQMLLKSEVEKITAEQTSAFESVRIRRLYKTGMGLPERIFVEHEKGYTFKERERLRYLMNNEII